MGYYAGWRPEKEKVMGLIIEVNTNQELREKMADGSVIKCIREYFERLREEELLPFGGMEDRICRDNATDYIEVSSHEKSIDYQTFARPRPGKLVEDLRKLILLAYDQVFSFPEEENPAQEVPAQGSPEQDVMLPDNRAFKIMHENFLEQMEKFVQEAVILESKKEDRYSSAKFQHARMQGVISYLFITNDIDVDAHKRLSDHIWSIYVSALVRIDEVH